MVWVGTEYQISICFLNSSPVTSGRESFAAVFNAPPEFHCWSALACAASVEATQNVPNVYASFKEASSLKQVEKADLPMFFIHGDKDTYVPTWMVYPLYEAKPDPKELWIVPGAKHAVSYKENKTEYTNRVKNFVDKYIE